jgi:hypothetical protein
MKCGDIIRSGGLALQVLPLRIEEEKMAQLDVVSLLMFLAGTGLFMVAGFAVCVALMIFCDIINLGGAFEKPAAAIISVVFAPILLVAGLFDTVMVLFEDPRTRESLRAPVLSPNGTTLRV